MLNPPTRLIDMARAPARAMTRGSPNLKAGALRPSTRGRSRDPLKGWTRKDTTLTDLLMVQQSAVHVTCLGAQLIKVLMTTKHPEVGRVVDDGLDPHRPAVAG